MENPAWQFWIDVGGTFTDCIARRPGGQLLRQKVLSSGATKGRVGTSSDPRTLLDPARIGDPRDFWIGYRICLFDATGTAYAESTVTEFDATSGRITWQEPFSVSPQPDQAYELDGGEEAPLLAIRYLLGLRRNAPLPQVVVRLGTTRGTNALITRTGAATALVTTRGFGDILQIGYQNRPRLFDLAIRKPEPLVVTVVEVDERITSDGHVLQKPDPQSIRLSLEALKESGVESLAICLMHAYRNPAHEELIGALARDVGFSEISLSSRVAQLIKIVARGDTTCVDAYLNPILRDYVRRLRQALDKGQNSSDLRMLTSAGGLVDADNFLGKDSILSGPAGGVVGFSRVARVAGFDRAIGFDMGGTSTDVSRFDGRYELQYETEKAGVRVVSPMMAIETVAAGGGSICGFDGVKLTVGPQSAGADPGPACYSRGGPLTVTDVNFFLGKILPKHFPFPLDRTAVERQIESMRAEIADATGQRYSAQQLAEGFVSVANANMVKAIRSISVAKGYDCRDYLLVAFGGAAPQHACAIATELGITQVLNHPDAGILSAYGIGLADVVRHQAAGVYRPLDEDTMSHAELLLEQLSSTASQQVEDEGIPTDRIEVTPFLDLRYQGTDAFLTIARPTSGDYAASFAQEHQRRYGYIHHDRPLEVVAVRVEAVGRSSTPVSASRRVTASHPTARESTQTWFHGHCRSTAVYDRHALRAGDRVEGPAIITEDVSTTVIDPGWVADVLSGLELLLYPSQQAKAKSHFRTDHWEGPALAERGIAGDTVGLDPGPPGLERVSNAAGDEKSAAMDRADPVLLELFNNQFAGIAEQMGITLRNTSSSVNVKERLDFSCAVFTASGDLVVNAPHIPVHLGAMSETVKCVLADNPDMGPGDVFVTNDPYRGGSHLPDITVVTPVFRTDENSREPLLFFTASRAHHAEIGGIAPGSMPPFSKCLAEEGVLIRNFKLVEHGQSRHSALRQLLLDAPYPTRSVEDNLADIEAQVAANHQGARDLLRLIEHYGWATTAAYMQHIQAAAETKMRAALSKLPDGDHQFVDHLDNGSKIAVTFSIRGDRAMIDFAGTDPVLDGNLNANRAIVTAAVMYCLRCLIHEDIPLNQGVLSPIDLELPTCLLNPPAHENPSDCAAVAGGNVETSQRIVDVLLGALGVAAASQGTMNNVLFGDASFGYYETICGGSGATHESNGADAVHTHMTNTRLTDPEVLELRYPVRVREFSIRQGSGGRGKRSGGNGVVRKLEFLRPLQVSILSQRRGDYLPYGLDGGQAAQRGENSLHRADGSEERLAGTAHFNVSPGDVLIIKTPGGGGVG
jgi:5-oxoprolinase (ATP-hydrolysing)